MRDTDGIGTEATRRESLSYYLSVVFVQRNIHSTEAGRILIQALPKIATLPDMTAHWEAQLDRISRKQANYQCTMAMLTAMLPDLIEHVDFATLRKLTSITK